MRPEIRLYLSGPMRGLLDLNYPAFNAMAEILRRLGFIIFNPAEHDMGSVARCFQVDFFEITRGCGTAPGCPYYDGIAVMRGWESSDGARAEVKVGMLMGLPIYCAEMLSHSTVEEDISDCKVPTAYLESVCGWKSKEEIMKDWQDDIVAEDFETAEQATPADAAERKKIPLCTGVLDYFPDALREVARVSYAGNEQHHPGKPLHWDRSKSTDQADCILRHLMERGTLDTDGMRHSAKVAWRALALCQIEIEKERET